MGGGLRYRVLGCPAMAKYLSRLQNQRGGKGGGSEKIGMWMDGDREG